MGWTGTRPRTNIGMLHRFGANVVVNGDFSDDTGWLFSGDGWDINVTVAGKAYCDGLQAGASCYIGRDDTVIIDETYRGIVTVTNYVDGWVKTYAGVGATTGAGPEITSNGTHIADGLIPTNPSILLVGDGDFEGECDDFIMLQTFLS